MPESTVLSIVLVLLILCMSILCYMDYYMINKRKRWKRIVKANPFLLNKEYHKSKEKSL